MMIKKYNFRYFKDICDKKIAISVFDNINIS